MMKIKFTSIFCAAGLLMGLQSQVAKAQCDTASIFGDLTICVGDTTVLQGPASGWTQKATPSFETLYDGVSFVIGTKAYLGTGMTTFGMATSDFWEYDPSTEVWTQKASLPSPRYFAVGFAIGNKGYMGLGVTENPSFSGYQDFWEYNPTTNTWTQKANFPGGVRCQSIAFSIGSKGYIGAGDVWNPNSYEYELATPVFYEYNPVNDTWTQKTDCPEQGFSIGTTVMGGKGYLVGITSKANGFSANNNNVYEYNPIADSWVQKTSYPGVLGGTKPMVSFVFNGEGHMGYPYVNEAYVDEFWKYNPTTDNWSSLTSLQNPQIQSLSFMIGNVGYLYGVDSLTQSVFLSYTPRASYSWSTGDTTQSITVSDTGTYTLNMAFSNSCPTSSASVTVVYDSVPSVVITGNDSICSGTSTIITASGGASFVWSTGDSTAAVNLNPTSDTTYYVTAIGANGCSATDSITVYVSVCSGINELGTNQNISLYPNPASNLVKISAKGALLETIKIYNLAGALVYEQAASKSEEVLNINIPAGVYYMHLKSDAGTNIKKFVVQ